MYKPKQLIREETIAAVKKVLDSDYTKLPLYTFEAPYHCHIDLATSSKCDVIQQMPGIKRVGGRSLEFTSSDYTVKCLMQSMALQAWDALLTANSQ